MLRANVVFEAKRLEYAFAGHKRDDLLAQIDACNNRLQDVLAANDRVSAIDQEPKVATSRRLNPKLLNFWRHAASIFTLLDKVWICTCRSNVALWLQHSSVPQIAMQMHTSLCHGHQSFEWRLRDTATIQLSRPRPPATPGRRQAPSIIVHSSSTSAITRSVSLDAVHNRLRWC